jgi:tRNA1(Val) A37 N6-methylase TrmN6
VGDYAAAAHRHLAEDGLFVFCFPALQKQRCIGLVCGAGFGIVSVRDVVPRRNGPALFSLYCARAGWNSPPIEEAAFVVAEPDGSYTEEMKAMQLSRAFGPDGTNVIR